MGKRTFTITALALEKGESVFVQTSVELASGIELGDWRWADDPGTADVLLINMDSEKGTAAMEQWRDTGPLVVGCSASGSDAEEMEYLLPRPLSYPVLMAFLRELEAVLRRGQSAVGLAEKAPAGTEEQAATEPEEVIEAEPAAAAETEALAEAEEAEALEDISRLEATRDTEEKEQSMVGEEERAETAPEEMPEPESTAEPDTGPVAETEDAEALEDLEDIAWLEEASTESSEEATEAETDGDEIEPSMEEVDEDQSVRYFEEEIPTLYEIAEEDFRTREVVEETDRLLRALQQGELGASIHDDEVEAKDEESVSGSEDATEMQEAFKSSLVMHDRPARRFYEATRLLGVIKTIIEEGEVVEITHQRFPPLRIYPEARLYASPLDDALVPQMFRTLASEFELRPLSKAEQRTPPEKWESRPLWKLLYVAAIFGSEGRLRENASPDDRLRMIAEPDFNVVPHTEEHQLVADYMREHEADLKTISEETGVDIGMVVDFANACEEVLLVEKRPLEPVQEGNEKRSQTAATAEAAQSEAGKPRGGLMKKIKSMLGRS